MSIRNNAAIAEMHSIAHSLQATTGAHAEAAHIHGLSHRSRDVDEPALRHLDSARRCAESRMEDN